MRKKHKPKSSKPTKPLYPPTRRTWESNYFGVPLQNLVTSDRPIPLFIDKCVDYIERTGESCVFSFSYISFFFSLLFVFPFIFGACLCVQVQPGSPWCFVTLGSYSWFVLVCKSFVERVLSGLSSIQPKLPVDTRQFTFNGLIRHAI
ncbi:hypothetical protein KUCAC02_037829 [Chaenocephalus aceratus]|nr:hypothetical protein KUCAC02_037829 [Chaenocephalus aceratus]